MTSQLWKVLGGSALLVLFASPSYAATCIGTCGTLGADGDVTAPPSSSLYQYVSTENGVAGAGQISGIGGTNGSEFTTDAFMAAVGDPLNFYFNFITSDGTGNFPDYGFAELQTAAGATVGYLFTARTVVSPGNTSPGFGLPANISMLTPATTAINDGATNWSPLGDSSGACYTGLGNGCGSTGWIQSTYSFVDAGSYRVRFGTSNFGDEDFQTGLAFAGVTVAGNPVITPIPEPATWGMMILGFGAIGAVMRRRQRVRVAFA